MSRKVIVIGGVAGGASTAARVRRLDEFAEIKMFEMGPYVSFSNCCIPFHISGTVEKADNLILMSPEQFKAQYNINAFVNHEVISINREEKYVEVKNLVTDEVFKETYDTLVLSPGAKALRPKSIEGVDSDHVFVMKTVPDLKKFMQYAETHEIKDVAVIGGGFIGIEVAENAKKAGYNVSIIEAQDQILAPLDYDMVQIVNRHLYNKGVHLHLSDGVKAIEADKVVLQSGKTVPAQAVVLAIGVAPNTQLAKESGIELNARGYIKVNHHYQTNDPDIYAVGDAIEVKDFFTGEATKLTLAGPAQRQARAAADSMYGRTYVNTGVIGSSSVKVFDMNVASTGLNEKRCKEEGINYGFSYIIPKDGVGLMPGSNNMFFKLLYAYPSGQVIGAQAVGLGNVTKRVDVIATTIMLHGNLEDLKELELEYSPHYGTAKDVVNHAALVALNILNGEFKKIPVSQVRELVENNAFIIDAREEDEYAQGHVINALNIPLSQFRDRLDEIPKDRPVYIYCRSSQRSYNMVRALGQRGYENVYNMDGSFLGISEHEYFNDQITGRKPIVTEYNFI
ncbi:FAD-dependent oxidoreductase [Aerococcus christensenii]|uniref:FAD-dependent oxidoreductase n=1 Tax=Aerococcus christensenii TaxID=87541 RepID=UPI00254E36E2|nr:FAD-dependent oxidoreductase [Aerococcus christensenii]MDK8233281.1 FAD-dependent oxidoreductase [Aerococcus christensenii]